MAGAPQATTRFSDNYELKEELGKYVYNYFFHQPQKLHLVIEKFPNSSSNLFILCSNKFSHFYLAVYHMFIFPDINQSSYLYISLIFIDQGKI